MPDSKLDAIAWRNLDSINPTPRPADRRLGEVRNYFELWERTKETGSMAGAWSAFLHGFFRHKDAASFAEPPPTGLDPGDCAMLAGTAEYLCRRYGLPIPAWTEKAEYFLEGRWEPLPRFEETTANNWVSFPVFHSEEAWERTEEEFRRRGLVFEARNLITL